MIDRLVALAMAAGAVVASMLAAAVVAAGSVGAGVMAENPGGRVLAVEAGSTGWQDGIRVGQRVVGLRAADEPGGWRIVTEAEGKRMESSVARHERKLRASWPMAAGSLGAAALGAVWLRRRRREAEMAACAAVILAAVPLAIPANGGTSGAVLSAALLFPAVWLARWTRWAVAVRALVLLGVVGLVSVWVVLRAIDPRAYAGVDEVRFAATVLLGGLLVATVLSQRRLGFGRWLRDPQASSAISLAVLVGLVLVLYAVVRLSVPAIVAASLLAVVAFPRLRRLIAAMSDRLLLADLRERLSAEATETERARLAREIHDAPLQELSGIIRQLDLVPHVSRQTDALRGVADQLRSVATQLHPPALEDLGLAAALRFIAEKARTNGPGVTIAVDVTEAHDASVRPPPDVELAVLRIAQEAIANAVWHSSAASIRLQAAIGAHAIELEVSDDGVGTSAAAVRNAQRRGSLGIASMERRAATIGAHLERLTAKPSGTRIRLRWPA